MAPIVKEGDVTAGVEGFNPTTVIPGTSTGTLAQVFIGGIGVVCQGDLFASHTNGTSTHVPVAGPSFSRVYVGPAKKEVFTNDKPMSPGCGDQMAPIPGTVLAG